MKRQAKTFADGRIGLLVAAVMLGGAREAPVIFSFQAASGAEPSGGLVSDALGNLFGVTCAGGHFGDGVAFVLLPPAAPGMPWTQTTLHEFRGRDGICPSDTLILDAAGNQYGSARQGGAHGDGTVFVLAPPAAPGLPWTETTLHAFDGRNGYTPTSLVRDPAGNLYGATSGGGKYNEGTVFKLTPPGRKAAPWHETILHDFSGSASVPGHLVLDAAGNLYGNTEFGGRFDDAGTVFRLAPPAGQIRRWTITVLHDFNHNDGYAPGDLIIDASGNLYGDAHGGRGAAGIVFKLTPPSWTETVLHAFNDRDGNSASSLILDPAGDLYGTTLQGGNCPQANGVLFRLSPSGRMRWTETELSCLNEDSFGLTKNPSGTLFGLSRYGGNYNRGAAFLSSKQPPS